MNFQAFTVTCATVVYVGCKQEKLNHAVVHTGVLRIGVQPSNVTFVAGGFNLQRNLSSDIMMVVFTNHNLCDKPCYVAIYITCTMVIVIIDIEYPSTFSFSWPCSSLMLYYTTPQIDPVG